MKPYFAPWTIPGEKPLVRFDKVTKRFGDATAVEELTLDIYEREFLALLGPSGCGKSTLLRLLAGLETADSGRILIADEDVSQMPPYLRPVNMMFQNYALFPHLSVSDNVAFGLRREGLPRAEISRRVDEMLTLVEMQAFTRRRPHQLSGGQRQRVALARSLAKRPRVLLLDEPMAALDRKLRAGTQTQLLHIQKTLGTTFIIVTHDQDEAMSLADRIAVMDRGQILQLGTPAEVYEQPASCWIANFVGESNLIEGEVTSVNGGSLNVAIPNGPVVRTRTAGDIWPGARVFVAVRPEKLTISHHEPSAPGLNCIGGQLTDSRYLGDRMVFGVVADSGITLRASVANTFGAAELPANIGDRVWLLWAPDAGIALDH